MDLKMANKMELAEQPLHVCARHMPDYNAVVQERAQAVDFALSNLKNGIANKDEKVALRGLRKVEHILDSLIVLNQEETVELVRLCCAVGFETEWTWTTLWSSGRALRVAGRLLSTRVPSLIPLVCDIVSWEKLLHCARSIHVLPEVEAKPRIGSDEAIRYHADNLGFLCRRARYYQCKGSAEKICEDLEQYISKSERDDDRMQESQVFLYMLYPGGACNDDPAINERVKSWITAWGRIDNSTEWDTAWFGLLKRVSKTRRADFSPFLSQLFGRFHASLRLSVGGSLQDQVSSNRWFSAWQSSLGRTTCCVKAAKLLVEILHFGDSIKRMEHLMMTVRTFIHPSNQGSHAERLSTFIASMCESFAKRLGVDLETGSNALADDVKVRFVEAVFPLIEMGLHSKSLSVVSSCQAALRHLAWVAPCTLAQKTLPDLVRAGLDPLNLTRSHQAPAAMKALTVLIQPLVFGGDASRKIIVPYLVQFLEQALPGIDPNDTRKTAVTMMLAYSVLSCIPLVDTSSLSRDKRLRPAKQSEAYGIDKPGSTQVPGVVTPVGMLPQNDDLWVFGPNLAEWGLAYLRRLYTLAQARGKRAKKGMSAQLDVVLDYFYLETATLCLGQMDKGTRQRAMTEIASFLLDEGALPAAHSEALAFARACTFADPELALKTMLPVLCARVTALADARTLSWALVALGGLVRQAGSVLLEYSQEVEQTILRSFAHKDIEVRRLGVKLVRRYARSLLDTYIVRDVVREDEELVKQMEGGWGSYEGDWENIKVSWHVPSPEEVERARVFLTGLTSKTFQGLLEVEQDKDTFHEELTEKQRLHHRLSLLHQIIRGSLTHIDSPSFVGMQRNDLIDKTLQICAKLQPTTDTDGLTIIIKCLSLLGSAAKGPRGAGNGDYVRAYSMWSAWLREISQSKAHEAFVKAEYRDRYFKDNIGSGAVPELMDRVEPRHVMLGHIENLFQKRTFNASFAFAQQIRDIEELERPYRRVGDALNELCVHPFSSVRIVAQRHRAYVDARFPWLARVRLMDVTLPRIGDASEGKPELFTGSLYMCGNEGSIAVISRRWEVFSRFVKFAVCDSARAIALLPSHRHVKAQERLAKLLNVILQKWHLFPKSVIPKGDMGQMLLTLSTFGNDSSTHWRRKLSACAVVGILVDPRFENEIPRETVSFVTNMARCEILPLRTVGLLVLRSLLVCGESVKVLTAHELSNKTLDFWLLAGATLAEDRSSAASEDQHADWSVGVGEFIKLVRGLMFRPKFPKGRFDPSAPKDFHMPKCDFWSAVCVLNDNTGERDGEDSFLHTVVLPTLKKLSTEGDSNKDRMVRRMAAAELFAGCLVVRPEWSESFFPVLARMLAELPNAANWCDAVSYVASFSPDQGKVLLQLLDKETDKFAQIAGSSNASDSMMEDVEPQTESEKERGFAYTSNLLKVMGSLVIEHRTTIAADMRSKFERALVHPYKSVRQSAATALAAFVVFHVCPHQEAVQAFLNAASKGKDGLESGLLFLAVLCALGESMRLLKSVIMPLVGPVVFQAQGHDDQELAKLAKNVLSIVAAVKCFSVPQQAVELEQQVCADFAHHADWPKRRAVANFLRSFHAHHTCLLLGMGAGALVQKTAEDLLMDSQAEVRDAARQLLLALLAAANPASLTSARDRYLRSISRPEPLKKRQGILALTALVEACPYSVPEAIPLSVLELSRHINGANGTQAKKTLSEFRRTHIDEWAEHKMAFTDEQLNELEGVLVSPDYYA